MNFTDDFGLMRGSLPATLRQELQQRNEVEELKNLGGAVARALTKLGQPTKFVVGSGQRGRTTKGARRSPGRKPGSVKVAQDGSAFLLTDSGFDAEFDVVASARDEV